MWQALVGGPVFRLSWSVLFCLGSVSGLSCHGRFSQGFNKVFTACFISVLRSFTRLSETVYEVSTMFLQGFQEVFTMFLQGVYKVFRKLSESFWKVSRKLLEGVYSALSRGF